MEFLRSAVFNVYFFVATFLVTTIPGTVARIAAPQRVLAVAQFWARIVLAGLRVICGIRFQVSGLEHVEGDGARLIASRHQSAFDTLVWLMLLPRCCYVLKQELLRIPLMGRLMTLAGMIAVDRSSGSASIRKLMRESDRAVREARQIVIFPEGTRSETGAMLPLQPGVAALAARTHLPVIPVVTDSGHCWGRRAFRKRPGTIHIRILAPIPAGLEREELMRRLELALRTAVITEGGAVENSVG